MAYTFKHGDRPIEGYTIQRAVGKGGFGEVYYAVSDGGREVAVKYLRDNPQVELRGVSHCINLKSPHLVSIFDVKRTADGEYVIIMEYCSGPSLRDLLIAEPNGFEPQKAAFFVREIAKGLSYLHDRGIVHRDLKPGNIFYDDGYVKIGDYGLSKFISVSRHSGQTASVGTVHYMAPEIGSGHYSKGVDIYALGVMLYEMLLGKVPFEGSSMAEVLMKHLTAQPEVEHLPSPFGSVIRKALRKDPNDRYQTADEMVEELLEVEAVRQSLAGFSTKSLEGAVRRGEPARADSPIPSPNRVPGYAGDFARPVGGERRQPPYAYPVGNDPVLRERVAKRMDRVSRKVEKKMAKLAGRRPRPAVPPPLPGAVGDRGAAMEQYGAVPHAGAPGAGALPAADRKKRVLLSGLLSLGLAVGLGVLIGNSTSLGAEAGVSTAMLVIAMSGGVMLAGRAIRWFAVDYGPRWSQTLIRLCCCAPLMALGAAPLLGGSNTSDEGAALWLGLLSIAAFGRWKRQADDSPGEMSFKAALWKGLCGLILVPIAGGIVGAGNVDEILWIGAGVAGATSLILQATAGLLPVGRERAVRQRGTGPRAEGEGPHGRAAVAPPAPPAGNDTAYAEAAVQQRELEAPAAAEARSPHPRRRWGITRAFWGVTAFVLIGGAIVTFLYPLVAAVGTYHDITTSIVACTGFASFMLFALRKTTPLKRDGFWRETVRPFVISLMMFGIGGTITGIAREWDHWISWNDYRLRCVTDEGRVALITGLVLCSLLFLGLTLFTGRRRRSSKPFVLGDSGCKTQGAPRTLTTELPDETPSNSDMPTLGVRADDTAAANATPAETVRPDRGVVVLMLGILGISLFPLGIAAWVMGDRDLREMNAGRMDASGRGITAAGRVCGIIGVIAACLGGLGGTFVVFMEFFG